MAAYQGHSNQPQNLASQPSDSLGELPARQSSLIYNDGNVSISEDHGTPGLRAITINIGPPPAIKSPGVDQRPIEVPLHQPQNQTTNQRQSQRQSTAPLEVVIPANCGLPLSKNPLPKIPPPDVTWPKDAKTNDVCEIRDIDAAAKLKTKYGDNPCKAPQPAKKGSAPKKPAATPDASNKDFRPSKPTAATDISNEDDGPSKPAAAADMNNEAGYNTTDNINTNNDRAELSKRLVTTDISDDGCGPSENSPQPMGSISNSDISNYGSPDYRGNYIPRKPAYSGSDHDIGGRFQTAQPYDPRYVPQQWPQTPDRTIQSSGQYAYESLTPPPTPSPPKVYEYDACQQPPPSRVCEYKYDYDPCQQLPPCPSSHLPAEERYYDAPEDFYYDACGQQDWCPPGCPPTGRYCNYQQNIANQGNFADGPLQSTARPGRGITHIRYAGFEQGEQVSGSTQSSENEDNGAPTIIIRRRNGQHKVGCPWQRKNHRRIQPGDVRNTSFNQTGQEDLEVEQRGFTSFSTIDELEQAKFYADWLHFENTADNGEQYTGELEPSLKCLPAMPCDSTEKPTTSHNMTFEQDFEHFQDREDDGNSESSGRRAEEYTDQLEAGLKTSQAIVPYVADLISPASELLDVRANPWAELEQTEVLQLHDNIADDVLDDSHLANPETQSSHFYYALRRRRSNPALPLILRAASWFRDVILPDYSR